MINRHIARAAPVDPLLAAVKELMAILVVQHEYDATELYDLADEVIRTVWEAETNRAPARIPWGPDHPNYDEMGQ